MFIGLEESDFRKIKQNAVIASGSIRRRAQLMALRPDLKFVDLRGNIETRLEKLNLLRYDGIIMAEAALIRLELTRIKYDRFSLEHMLPAVGQGAIGVQTRKSDHQLAPVLKYINNIETETCVSAERSFLHQLDSGCQFPVAANATIIENNLHLIGLVASKDGKIILKDSIRGSVQNPEELGAILADNLIRQGARDILSEA